MLDVLWCSLNDAMTVWYCMRLNKLWSPFVGSPHPPSPLLETRFWQLSLECLGWDLIYYVDVVEQVKPCLGRCSRRLRCRASTEWEPLSKKLCWWASPTKHLFTQPRLNSKQERWMDSLREFEFKVKHIKGKENKVVDALSFVGA